MSNITSCFFCMLVVLWPAIAAAHNGRVAIAYPVQGVTIDGDLSDWPQDLPRYPIASQPDAHNGSRQNINAIEGESDFRAFFQVGYNSEENALYIAVEVDDQSPTAIAHNTYAWGTSDMMEVLIDPSHSREEARSKKYGISGVFRDAPLEQAQVVFKQHADKQYGEWRFDLNQIAAHNSPLRTGAIMGFDIAVWDVDADSSVTKRYWGEESESYAYSTRFGDLVLVGEAEHTGFLEGHIRWPDNSSAQRIKVEIQSLEDSTSWLTIKTDHQGQFSTSLPTGSYLVKALRREQQVQLTAGTTEVIDLIGSVARGSSTLAGDGRPTRAGPGMQRGKWRSWNASDGLISETIYAILQDRKGVMWFGTGWSGQGKGLVRYNGERFTQFTERDGLLAGKIKALLEDSAGNIWIGTENGLVRYDRQEFTSFTIEDGLPANTVLSLFEDQERNLWIGTVGGVARFDGEKFINFTEEDGLPASTVLDIAQNSEGQLFFAAGGLARYDGSSIQILSKEEGLVSNEFTHLEIDSADRIWLCADDGVRLYDHGRWETVLTDSSISYNWRLSYWETAVEDDHGRMWFASRENGITRLEGTAWRHFDAADAQIGEQIMVAYKDLDGRIWFASKGGGISYYDESFAHTYTVKDGLPHNLVFDIEEGADGRIWLGTSSGLAHIKDGVITHDLPWLTHTAWDITEDPNGQLWIGTWGGGIIRYDGKETQSFTAKDGLSGNVLRALMRDSKGNIWASAAGKLSLYDGHQWQTYTEQDGVGHYPRDILEDSTGRVWLATDSGLSLFNGKESTLFTTEDGLPSNEVSSIVEGKNGRLWLGMHRGGFARYDGKHFEHFGAENGYDDDIQSGDIMVDRRGALWIGSWGGGVTLFDGLAFQKLRREHGLPNSAIQEIAQARDGTMWIAHEAGVTHYLPRQITPTVEIRNVSTEEAHGPIEDLSFPSDRDYLLFEFQGASLNTQPDHFVYVYRLKGHIDEWQFTRLSQVEFHDLPAGQYTFEVKAVDHDLNYSAPVQVDLRIHWPYERIAWISSLGLALLLIGWQTRRVVRRDRRLRESNRQLGEQAKMLTRERAAERLRAEALAMRSADDLRSLSVMLHKEMEALGVQTHGCNISFMDEVHGQIMTYQANIKSVEQYVFPDYIDPIYPDYVLRTFSVPIDSPVWHMGVECWRKQEIDTFESDYTIDNLNSVYKLEGAEVEITSDTPNIASKLGKWHVTNVPFEHGLVGFAVHQSNLQHIEIIRDLTDALSLGYLRFLDFQKLEEQNRTLETARVAAEEANRAKSLFLANMSHEIRTPMNAILGYAQILQRSSDLAPDHHKAVATIRQSGDHLLNLINDVLDISKIEAGRMELQPSEFDLQNIVQTIATMFEIQCREKGLTWDLDPLPGASILVHGDEGKLRQVLINLLGNATKFTEEGEVRLRVQSPAPHRYRFEIIDTGPGISREEQKTLFQAFQQGAVGTQYGGTGLGLAISQKQLTLMGAQLAVESELGKGTRFFFELDLAPAEGAVTISDTSADYSRVTRLAPEQNLSILIADDVAENREILQRMLSDIGCTVETATNGREALQRIELSPPDLVFMDIRMPVLDGVQALQLIRENDAWRQTKVIAISASVLEHERAQYLSAGFDDFIDKPFRFEHICHCLAQQLGVHFAYAQEASANDEYINWGELTLPSALYQKLHEAAELYSVTELETYIEEVEALASEYQPIATHLRQLNLDQDMDTILTLLAEIHHE